MPINDYKADLLNDLKDLGYAAAYLSAASRESIDTFLLALRDVAEAQIGISALAREADVNRENLYRMLSEEGNPRLSSLDAILGALNLRLAIEPQIAQITSPSSGGSLQTPTNEFAQPSFPIGTSRNVTFTSDFYGQVPLPLLAAQNITSDTVDRIR